MRCHATRGDRTCPGTTSVNNVSQSKPRWTASRSTERGRRSSTAVRRSMVALDMIGTGAHIVLAGVLELPGSGATAADGKLQEERGNHGWSRDAGRLRRAATEHRSPDSPRPRALAITLATIRPTW